MWSLNYLFLLAGAITTVKGRGTVRCIVLPCLCACYPRKVIPSMWSMCVNWAFLFFFPPPILTTNRPTDGFYQAPIGSPCPDADKITDEATCRSAADGVVHTFAKSIDTTCNVGTESGQQRPNGCFHGKVYYRRHVGREGDD